MEPARKAGAEPSPVERLRSLVESGRVDEARAFLGGLEDDSPEIAGWRLALALPTGRLLDSATGDDSAEELDWLSEHAEEYRGKWVAFDRGRYLDSDEDRVALHKRIGDRRGLRLVRVPRVPLVQIL
jgi:hypothetical protein